ncbi:MAG: (d)CMP kinase [Acidobacteria bacterium]|nr:(d)CMP kinase [Acidobacteriota bacterium]
MTKRIVVAIDGPGGAGKSTLARRVAEKLGCVYIDTGAMYRAVALWAARLNIDLADMPRLEQLAEAAEIRFEAGSSRVLLNGEDVTEAVRAPEMSQAASRISALRGVRRALVEKQRAMGAQSSVVMEGRDIGTVVFPDATVKIYLDADPRVRAERRVLEMRLKGVAADAGEVASELRDRDARDTGRADSPLRQAPDAVYLDSTPLSPEEVERAILKIVRDRTSNGKEISQ